MVDSTPPKPVCPTCRSDITELPSKKNHPKRWECPNCGELINPNYTG